MDAFVGIDLAWGTRGRTGLAVVGDDGALVASGVVGDDAELGDWLTTHAAPMGELAVVALDAPLVVPNATGQRPAERELNRDFARFHASTHVVNRARPYFDPPRGELLADRHGWVRSCDRSVRPAAIEVYPHAAMVALFGLARVVAYKAKPGRTVESRRAAFGQLLDRLEGLPELGLGPGLGLGPRGASVGGSRWAEIRAVVASAGRQVDLNRVEDEIDAVLCAHLAWRWTHRPREWRVYGDDVTGFVAVPQRLCRTPHQY